MIIKNVHSGTNSCQNVCSEESVFSEFCGCNSEIRYNVSALLKRGRQYDFMERYGSYKLFSLQRV